MFANAGASQVSLKKVCKSTRSLVPELLSLVTVKCMCLGRKVLTSDFDSSKSRKMVVS